MWKQHSRCALNLFLNGAETLSLPVRVNTAYGLFTLPDTDLDSDPISILDCWSSVFQITVVRSSMMTEFNFQAPEFRI